MGHWGVKAFIAALFSILVLGGIAMAQEKVKIGVIVVDIQGDFTKLKNGSLAVEGTNEAYIKAIEENTRKLKGVGFPIYATQDWHPNNHTSFFISHKGKKQFDVIKLHIQEQV